MPPTDKNQGLNKSGRLTKFHKYRSSKGEEVSYEGTSKKGRKLG